MNVFATQGPVAVFSIGSSEADALEMPVVAEWTHIGVEDVPVDRAGLNVRMVNALRSRPYPIAGIAATAMIDRMLSATVTRFGPDLVVLEHWKNGLPEPLKNHPNLVLDMHNIESLLGTEARAIRNPLARELLLWRWRRRERQLARNVRRVWVCGENDVAELARLDKRLPAPHVWPNGVDVTRYVGVRDGTLTPIPQQRNGATIIYVGFYRYAPNAQAAQELIEQIFPLIAAQVPDARLLLVGASPSKTMVDAAARDSRILVTDAVADIRPYLAAADVSILPLRSGGGTRLKILEAFAANIPVVSTAKGAEGISLVTGREISFGETSDVLAASALRLLADHDARKTQLTEALALVEQCYSWSALERDLELALGS